MRAIFQFAFAAAMTFGSAGHGHAEAFDQEAFRKQVQPFLGKEVIKQTKEMPGGGVIEIATENGIYYANTKGTVVFVNAVAVDTNTKENLSEKSFAALNPFVFKDLPLQNAVKVVRGDGSAKLVTFEDPNCGYCKALMAQTAKLTNVTIYTFVVPVLGGDSPQKSQAVMCSSNPAKSWIDYMSGAAAIPEKKDCKTPVDANLALYNKLKLRGVPALLFESNTKASGMMPADQIELKLRKAAS